MGEIKKHGPRAVRIVEIDEKKQQFVLNEDALRGVLHKVPEDMKISVVSVVGAFRTGKSFILDFFLRYLRATDGSETPNLEKEADRSWLQPNKGSANLEGNVADTNGTDSSATGGFGWRSGRERCTTGIWMWSEYFERQAPKADGSGTEPVAVLLVDTQGMFDSTLGQMLTASIFGLSTLISSYQIYNLDKRVQEDNLQHLALFTEYGRVALAEERKLNESQAAVPNWTSDRQGDGEHTGVKNTPFQRMEFLVRDWQNFDDENGDMESILEEMNVYLGEVLNQEDKAHKDLTQVREHIQNCFEVVSCFLLPHPGKEVTKQGYNGDVSVIDPSFKRLLSEYVRRVFSSRLVCKRIHGREVNSRQLFLFIKAYCELFRKADIFPEAKTLLAATSEANNRAAVDAAIKVYRKTMDPWAGPNAKHIEDEKLQTWHKEAKIRAHEKFKKMATLGAATDIKTYETELTRAIDERYRDYREANTLRDPYAFIQPFVVPILIALVMYVLRMILDMTCTPYSSTCSAGSDFMGTIYIAVFTFIILHAAARAHGVHERVAKMLGISGIQGGL